MPLKKKKNPTLRNILIWATIIAIIILMIISFAPVQHINEIVVYPS